jgi:hypothetical protein
MSLNHTCWVTHWLDLNQIKQYKLYFFDWAYPLQTRGFEISNHELIRDIVKIIKLQEFLQLRK